MKKFFESIKNKFNKATMAEIAVTRTIIRISRTASFAITFSLTKVSTRGCSTGVTIGIVGFIYMVFLLSERCGGDAGASPLCGYAINPRN